MLYYYFTRTNQIRISQHEIHSPWFTPFTEEQVEYYKEHPRASAAMVRKCHEIIQSTMTIEKARENKIKKIVEYDVSENVNLFYYNEIPMWLDKATRVGLVNTINSAELIGKEGISIWYGGYHIDLNLMEARYLLAELEMYATECYNVTEQHKVNVNALDSISDVEVYDITTNYPEKLHFNADSEETGTPVDNQ